MYIQRCVKGIVGRVEDEGDGISKGEAANRALRGMGLESNWWRKRGVISPADIENVLTESNLDRHLHDYDAFKADTPFISLACGAVERDALVQRNFVYSARDTALMFATEDWTRPGALFYLWVPVSYHRAVPLSAVAEPVRDLNIYQRWSPYQLEGEITAKVGIPANQIEKVEWWDAAYSKTVPQTVYPNPTYVEPDALSNIRDLF
jgi:hypothetical protein